MATSLPPLPAVYKPLKPYLRVASEHDTRDPIISYYCRLYALQKGMEIDKKSPEARQFLMGMMDFLETMKTQYGENEAIHNEVVGQAHMESVTIKLFLHADNEDRAGNFSTKLVKLFYTCGLLFDALDNFGELSEDLIKNRKYAKWKALYIKQCMDKGETPVAGPMDDEEEGGVGGPVYGTSAAYGGQGGAGMPGPGPSGYPPAGGMPGPSSSGYPPQMPATNTQPSPPGNLPVPGAHAPPTTPSEPAQRYQPPPNPSGMQLKPEVYQRAMKLCKFAGSSLQYEDAETAIDYLSKALNLLTTGTE